MNLVHVRVLQELLNPQNTSPHQNGKMIQNPYTLGHNRQQQMGSFVYRLPQRLVNCQHMAEFAKQISLIQGNGYTLNMGPKKPNLYTANTATATTGILHYGTQKIQSLT